MIGGQVLQYPDLVLRAYKAGHELAIHTFSHSYLTTQSTESIVGELKWTEQAIFEVTGVHPKLFRPVRLISSVAEIAIMFLLPLIIPLLLTQMISV
jgi:peptidoglycan/xylan/chitin deacetylase (PgdA/CDA1 family)